MKLIYKVYLAFLIAEKRECASKLNEVQSFYKNLKTFRYHENIDPTEFEFKKDELEKKINLLTSKCRYLAAKINSIKWKLF